MSEAREITIRRRDLESALTQLEPHPSPSVILEQYTIPPDIAAEMVYLAAYTFEDIVGKRVFDLGCGTGRLAISAAILGAREVVGVDVDGRAIDSARRNAALVGVEKTVTWVVSDISLINDHCDTVLQNPPFGVKSRGADRVFVQKALEIGRVIYSLHKAGPGNRRFLGRLVNMFGGDITHMFTMKLSIPPTFQFHRDRRHVTDVDLYRMTRR